MKKSGENQHYVSKFLLKNFADIDGKVFWLNKKTDEVKKRPPKFLGSRIDFNELSIEGKAISFESAFEKLETRAGVGFKKIKETGSLKTLDANERRNISNFIATQAYRTLAFREGLSDKDKENTGKIYQQLWESSFIISNEIETRRWILMNNSTNMDFYLGDNPVVLQNTENPGGGQTLGFDISGVEAYLPITPKLALYMPCNFIFREMMDGYRNAHPLQQQALKAMRTGQNRLSPDFTWREVLLSANKIISDSSGFFNAAIKQDPLEVLLENVENLNYLQVSWAYDSVFSQRKDFSFAIKVLTQSPQYRNSNKSKVVPFGSKVSD